MDQKQIFLKIKENIASKPILLATGVVVTLGLLAFLSTNNDNASKQAPQPTQTEEQIVTASEAAVTTEQQERAYDLPPHIALQTLELNSREPRKLVLPEFVPPTQADTQTERWIENAVKVSIPEGMAKVVIIIDDVGMNYSAAKDLSTIKSPLTIAFLPYAAHVDDLAREAKAAGHELMIHMPMEPMNPDLDTGPIALKTEYDSRTFDSMLDKALASFDGYVGMNNHMGSRLTQDPESMRRLMDRLYREGMLFVDSRTIASSVAEQTANDFMVPNIARDVFLDDDPSAEAVHKSLMKVEAVARKYGTVVAIGHPKTETIKALKEWLPTLADKGMMLVPVSAVIEPPSQHSNN